MKKNIFAFLALILICGVFTGCKNIYKTTHKTTDVSEYGIYSGHIDREEEELFTFQTKLAVFPTEIKDSYIVNSYYYSCSQWSLDNLYMVILDYTLPKAEFEAEVSRIAGIGATTYVEKAVEKPLYNETAFTYPAYIAKWWGEVSECEYALMDAENNRIICVFSSFPFKDVPLEDGLAPKENMIPEYQTEEFTVYDFFSDNN